MSKCEFLIGQKRDRENKDRKSIETNKNLSFQSTWIMKIYRLLSLIYLKVNWKEYELPNIKILVLSRLL